MWKSPLEKQHGLQRLSFLTFSLMVGILLWPDPSHGGKVGASTHEAQKRGAAESQDNHSRPHKSLRLDSHSTANTAPELPSPSAPNPALSTESSEEDDPQDSPVLVQDIQQIFALASQVELFNSTTNSISCPSSSSSSSSSTSSIIPTGLSNGTTAEIHTHPPLLDNARFRQLITGLEPSLRLLPSSLEFTYPFSVLENPSFEKAFDPEAFRLLKEHLNGEGSYRFKNFRIYKYNDRFLVLGPKSWKPAPGYIHRNYILQVRINDKEGGRITIKERWTPQETEIYIVSIDIDPIYRRKGLASSSLQTLTRFYDQQELNIKNMTLSVESKIPIAALIYARLGFEVNQKVLETLSQKTGMSIDRLRAKYLMDSTPPILNVKVKDENGILQDYIKKWDLLFHPDLYDDFLNLAAMHRPRGAKGFSVSTKATEEEIMKAYQEAHQSESSSSSSSLNR